MDYRDHVKHKVVDVVRTVPLDLLPEDTPEAAAEEKKNDMLADKQVRHILWTGLGLAVVQLGVPFRLTFLWDVVEPSTFLTTTAGIVIRYA